MSLVYDIIESLEESLLENVSSRFDRKAIYYDVLSSIEQTEVLSRSSLINSDTDECLTEAWEELHPEEVKEKDELTEDDDVDEFWSDDENE